jgi:hypothetical protein
LVIGDFQSPIKNQKSKMASTAKFRHEDIRAVPKGWKVRTITHESGHRVRVAYPPGPRKKGAGEVISILHPLTGSNPCANPCKANPGIIAALKEKFGELKEKVKAAVSKKTESNPKRNRKSQITNRKSKKNLDEIKQAAQLAGKFKGSPAENVREIDLSNKQRDDYAHLGWMEQQVYHPPFDHAELDLPAISEDYRHIYDKSGDSIEAWRAVAKKHGVVLLVFDLTGDEVELASSADGQQLYFLGGNQRSFEKLLGQFKSDTARDKVDLGEMVSVTYTAQKKQAGDTTPNGYYHVFAEERGMAPRAYYDMLNKRIFLTGGNYHLKEPDRGIIN